MQTRKLGNSNSGSFGPRARLHENDLWRQPDWHQAGDDLIFCTRRLTVASRSSIRRKSTGRSPTKNSWAKRWRRSAAQVVIATKFGFKHDPQRGQSLGAAWIVGRSRSSGSPRHRSSGCGSRSLILFYQHRVDPNVPIEDVAGAVKDLIQAGKVKHFGLSEARRRQPSAAPTPSSPSPPCRANIRSGGEIVEAEVLPTCEELGIGLVPYSPLGRGYLTGKIDENTTFASTDIRSHNPSLYAGGDRRKPGRG